MAGVGAPPPRFTLASALTDDDTPSIYCSSLQISASFDDEDDDDNDDNDVGHHDVSDHVLGPHAKAVVEGRGCRCQKAAAEDEDDEEDEDEEDEDEDEETEIVDEYAHVRTPSPLRRTPSLADVDVTTAPFNPTSAQEAQQEDGSPPFWAKVAHLQATAPQPVLTIDGGRRTSQPVIAFASRWQLEKVFLPPMHVAVKQRTVDRQLPRARFFDQASHTRHRIFCAFLRTPLGAAALHEAMQPRRGGVRQCTADLVFRLRQLLRRGTEVHDEANHTRSTTRGGVCLLYTSPSPRDRG